ncbi:PorP/SprF family type IX secretion system membrane protein [Riemerella columbina]|uniref:PorP/SprF family type IX secretion system membrane protein n=1 Tax=Riemerella columbina TaxID=103810 RepID=UPI00037568AF|nr:PorP/SprF family type IX secretion system membrane protein [Riemerella columbina]
MKQYFSFIFLWLLVELMPAQETIPYNQQYLLDGAYLFNPALLGATDQVELNANYQKQWSKFDQSPNVQSVGIHANIFDRVGGGAYFFRDQNGAWSANGIAVGASYFIPLSDDGDRKDQFSFGTSVDFYNSNIDLSLLNPKDSGDPLLQENTNGTFLVYSNIGLQAIYQNFFASVSVANIPLSGSRVIVNGIEPSPTKFYIHTGYDWNFTDGLSLEPSVLVNLNTNSARIIDLNLLAKVKNEDNYFAGGVSYRTSKSAVGSQQLLLSPVIKTKFNGLSFGATYNFNLSKIAEFSGNSFMLSLGYSFDNFINPRGFRYR